MPTDATLAITFAVIQALALLAITVGIGLWSHFAFRALREATGVNHTLIQALVALKTQGQVVVASHQPINPEQRLVENDTGLPPNFMPEDIG